MSVQNILVNRKILNLHFEFMQTWKLSGIVIDMAIRMRHETIIQFKIESSKTSE